MAKTIVLTGFIASILLLSLIAYSFPAFAQNSDTGKPDVIAVSGISHGKDMIVHILVEVAQGSDKKAAAATALAEYGARPFTAEEFSTLDNRWDQFTDLATDNNFVTQHYNPQNEPTDSKDTFQRTQSSWNGVNTSIFEFKLGENTDRCPSLVKECKGPQKFDGYNDVAWVPLTSRTTLGVTWTGINIDEADMALNTKKNWNTTYDIETVFLHENGHAAGLGHSEFESAVMFWQYSGLNRDLRSDDMAGISFLYPVTSGETEPTCGAGTELVNGICQVIIDEPEATGTSVETIAYQPAGGKNDDKHLLITLHVVDDSGSDAAGADVSISISSDTSRIGWGGSASTGTDGEVTFQLSNAKNGCYTTTVNSVTFNGINWDGEQPSNNTFCKS